MKMQKNFIEMGNKYKEKKKILDENSGGKKELRKEKISIAFKTLILLNFKISSLG